ncbi:corticotropin-releasing factor-binding protein-like isoform X1 [Centruroides sculpturatus]|uniref:corticotropin-releasing factor-binding protein-like isoform X1 n=2 Tax=Centruroides sculpturatus TaxID=218467 RepID=UPI000C6CD33C|nr:corticotropin-releasing factor-binding protein-like isoform X1 [Centruroides sculpturatus]XP_023220071.1 corticotropin-releasing factor-binding protein-like isoform X1 [Centruroides sculpturatus]
MCRNIKIRALLFCFAVASCSTLPKQNEIKRRLIREASYDDGMTLNFDQSGNCIFMRSQEGTYTFMSPGSQQVCGLYIITEPEYIVEFEFENFDISCSKEGLLTVMDGWELSGQFFPGLADHQKSLERRYHNFCGIKKPHKVFKMSQNVGLLEFRVPISGDGFSVAVRFLDNPKPCNAVLYSPAGVYTLRNHGRPANCSISIIYPETIQILSTNVGNQRYTMHGRYMDVETGTLHKCKKRGMADYVEIRGGDGLDPGLMSVAEDFCGLDSFPNIYLYSIKGKNTVDIGCGNTAVRLVSSGQYENSVTFEYSILSDFSSLSLLCPGMLSSLSS